MRSLLALLLGCALAGCASSAIDLEASPREVPADGVASSLIVARPTQDGNAAPDGTVVTLSTTLGSFRPDQSDVRELKKEVALGTVEARLFAPSKPGKATVKAEMRIAGGEAVKDEVEVRFVEPPAAVAVALWCDAKNLGALVPDAPVLEAECHAVAFDAGGAPLPSAKLGFMAEAGRLFEEQVGASRRLVYATGAVPPLDVDPVGEEPHWRDGDIIRNPRDGVVTLVAYVERPFPTARAQGEPYVDANDSGAYDPGEVYFDVDGNSQYGGPGSGVAAAWAVTRLVWSGALALTPLTAPSPAELDISDGGSEAVTFALTDVNLNPLAAGRGGQLTLRVGPRAWVAPSEILLGDALGFSLDAAGRLVEPGRRASWMQGVRHTVWVGDARTDAASDEEFSLSGTLVRPLTPGVAGGIAPPRTEAFPAISGVLRGP